MLFQTYLITSPFFDILKTSKLISFWTAPYKSRLKKKTNKKRDKKKTNIKETCGTFEVPHWRAWQCGSTLVSYIYINLPGQLFHVLVAIQNSHQFVSVGLQVFFSDGLLCCDDGLGGTYRTSNISILYVVLEKYILRPWLFPVPTIGRAL